MNFNEIIQRFSTLNPRLDFHVDDTGVVRLRLSEEHIIYLRNAPDGETFFLYAKAGELPATDEKKLSCLQRLLEANLFGDGVGLAEFAVHSESGGIILTQTFPAHYTDYAFFEAAYGRFLEYLLYWSEEIKRQM